MLISKMPSLMRRLIKINNQNLCLSYRLVPHSNEPQSVKVSLQVSFLFIEFFFYKTTQMEVAQSETQFYG